MNREEYSALFSDPDDIDDRHKEADSRAGRALAYALDIRKFEIELYWKRATYFWAFIATAFAGYVLSSKSGDDIKPWLMLLFSALGLVFSFAWYLVNRGSKFWQNNWERHVDLLEDITLGPLYKVVAEDISNKNPITAAAKFSVSKINQILSVFITVIWLLIFVKSILPISQDLPLDPFKIIISIVTAGCLCLLYNLGRSSNGVTRSRLHNRSVEIENQNKA